jgi:hypothetical protein
MQFQRTKQKSQLQFFVDSAVGWPDLMLGASDFCAHPKKVRCMLNVANDYISSSTLSVLYYELLVCVLSA